MVEEGERPVVLQLLCVGTVELYDHFHLVRAARQLRHFALAKLNHCPAQ